jgi:membrane protein
VYTSSRAVPWDGEQLPVPTEAASPNGFKRWWGLIRATLDKSAEEGARDFGAAIAYYAFFSVFPLLVGLTAVSGFFLDSPSVQLAVFDAVEEAFPGSGAFVEENLSGVVAMRGTLGLLGVLGLLWSGSAGFGAVSRMVNHAWGTPSDHPVVLQWIRHFAMTVVTVLLLSLSIGVTAAVEVGQRFEQTGSGRILGGGGVLGRLPGWASSMLAMLVVFTLVYKVIPRGSKRWMEAVPGAIVATILFEIGKLALVFYLETIADFSVYGSLGSIIVLLLWLYISARVLIFGAQFNVVLDRSRVPRPAGG